MRQTTWLFRNELGGSRRKYHGEKVPHRHFVFSIPKILRRYFLYDRRLLHDLSRCAWESLKVFMQDVIPERDPLPGAVIAVQTFGDLLGFNPHWHILITDHLLDVLTRGQADAALIASMVHFRSYTIAEIKTFLHDHDVKTRMHW